MTRLVGVFARREPLETRKATLASVLRKAATGIQRKEHMVHSEAEVVFRHACKMGLEGIVSKRLGSHYRSGRALNWLKMKNPAAPAVRREAEERMGTMMFWKIEEPGIVVLFRPRPGFRFHQSSFPQSERTTTQKAQRTTCPAAPLNFIPRALSEGYKIGRRHVKTMMRRKRAPCPPRAKKSDARIQHDETFSKPKMDS